MPWVEVGRLRLDDAPKMGPRPGGGRWLKATRDWFETWRRAAWAHLFEETDWNSLRRAAFLLDQVYRGEAAASVMGEIRQIEAKCGATLRDRQDLRLKVHARPATADVAEPSVVEGRPALRVAPDPRRPLEVSA